MQTHSNKSNDDLIQGIKNILSKNRCSFSKKEQVLLKDCVKKLEALKVEPNRQNQEKTILTVLDMLTKVFTLVDNVKDLF